MIIDKETYRLESTNYINEETVKNKIVIGNIFDNPELLSKVILNPYQMED